VSRSFLFTDFYELTMAQGYFQSGHNPDVVFDMFFRRTPYNGGYTVFAGLEDLLTDLEELRFSREELIYLESLNTFGPDFLDYLRSLRFSGTVHAFREGSLVFPGEPLVRISAPLIEAQLIESLLLNILNFQSLIATKSARVFAASGEGKILEFGMRRAQGYDGALRASRAAYLGGAAGTSNTLAGFTFGIPVLGTMAHSWIMAFDSELEAFRRYAELYPDTAILLIDTYDTLSSGLKNAIIVGLELKQRGKALGVRLDSGDLAYLSKQVRKELDKAGLDDAKITVSGDLNEQIIAQLIDEGAPIDSWGVGTQLATGHPDAALAGVYKLAGRWTEQEFLPAMKVSNNSSKMTNPGRKQVYRFYDSAGSPLRDLICLDEEKAPQGTVELFHPTVHYKHIGLSEYASAEAQLVEVMRDGRRCTPPEELPLLRERVINGLKSLDETFLRMINPHEYKISLSRPLRDLKFRMIDEYGSP
jgi:nicotinate phosphoribosyltransferase